MPTPAPFFEVWHSEGIRALETLETHLSSRCFMVGGRLTIADIGLYAYVHVAPQGGFELTNYPSVTAWLGRVMCIPGVLPIDANPEAVSVDTAGDR